MRAFDGRPRQEAIDAGILERARVNAVQPVDLRHDIVDQRRPVEAHVLTRPAEIACVLDLAAIAAAIDKQLFRNAAADHAGPADAIFLGDADAHAELGG